MRSEDRTDSWGGDERHPLDLHSRFLRRYFSLSQRELEVLRGIFRDHTSAAIALRIGVSPHTVHTYTTRLFAKLNATSRVTAVVRACSVLIPAHVEPEAVSPRRFGHGVPAAMDRE
jgi:DNA-binding CsgD family transcriptional regulator